MARARERVSDATLRQALRKTFGLKALRPGQQRVIDRVIAGLPTLALMPTGAGKSLCYQLPASLSERRTVVVSPLIALMKDQCDGLNDLGIAAVQAHSGLNAAQRDQAEQAIADGSAQIVFTTPEQLARAEFVAALQSREVGLLVVDEAHCISQWGFDFRPAFLAVGAAIEALGKPNVLALTATATQQVIDDVTQLLKIPQAGVIGTDLFRENLHYRAEHFSRMQDKLPRLVELVGATTGSGIVYVATIKAAEEVHAALVKDGQSAALYHGRLPSAKRRQNQDDFMEDRVRVMVATNAFGLGIDKPDIRFVVHYQMPGGLDAYYQESGRAGRDGEPAVCTLMFVDADRSVQKFFLAGRYPDHDDFRHVVQTLASPAPPESVGWTIDALCEGNSKRQRKIAVALNVLRNEGLAEVDLKGAWRLHPDHERHLLALDDHLVSSLVVRCRQKAERDQAMLERMVAYAQGGRCRWSQLLEHLEDEGPVTESCGTCDNCLRLAEHEAFMAQTGDAAARQQPRETAVPTANAIVVKPEVRFEVGQRVKTRRHGAAEVVKADALSITVLLGNGETRSFQPEFLQPLRTRRTAGGSMDAR
ncbi:RecQ family ATP-dependent DNA helicase [Piscinibacter sakaiensis]|uniref:RecQ family ATP-dependent DNA helicase n=1 Tax=Piscinibacter sakaiensis TaxID=1547922 RepID=UPI003AAEB04A